jgi:hypothetical protein
LPPDAEVGILGFDQEPLEVSRRGQLFFQPLDLHVEPTDLLVEFGLEYLALVPLAATAVTEQRLGAVEELLLPLADLDRVGLKGLDGSARVRVCLAAPRATRALKAAEYRSRVPAMTVLGMEQ